jgi:hypothetical protein
MTTSQNNNNHAVIVTTPHALPTMSKTKKAARKAKASSKKQKVEEPELTNEEKRVIMIQYEKENDAGEETNNNLLKEYLRFMQIKIAESDTSDKKVAPSKKIDELWHAHILSTKEYMAFCERYNDGVYIHHDPSMQDVPERYTLLWKKYAEKFGSAPNNASIWPTDNLIESEDDEGEEGYSDFDDYGCG